MNAAETVVSMVHSTGFWSLFWYFCFHYSFRCSRNTIDKTVEPPSSVLALLENSDLPLLNHGVTGVPNMRHCSQEGGVIRTTGVVHSVAA